MKSTDPLQFDTAERAIEVFERLHGLNVTVHDLLGTLAPFLKPSRLYHRSPLCMAVKARGGLAACLQFEEKELRRSLASLPDGRFHVCHANLVEWAVPIFRRQQLMWIIFAGPRSPGQNLSLTPHRTNRARASLPPQSLLAPPVNENEAETILEHLRQLAARLEKWIASAAVAQFSRNPTTSPKDAHPALTRQILVRQFIEEGYPQNVSLPMLAHKLGISEGRTSHFVREAFGTSFRELLVQRRLKAAMEFLQQSNLSVLEIALASGFGDLAHFHRLFRRRMGTTPLQYRRGGRA